MYDVQRLACAHALACRDLQIDAGAQIARRTRGAGDPCQGPTIDRAYAARPARADDPSEPSRQDRRMSPALRLDNPFERDTRAARVEQIDSAGASGRFRLNTRVPRQDAGGEQKRLLT